MSSRKAAMICLARFVVILTLAAFSTMGIATAEAPISGSRRIPASKISQPFPVVDLVAARPRLASNRGYPNLPEAPAKNPQSQNSRPNIVLIFTDDQGMHDVGCYGSEIPTPHMDTLAKQGLKFNSFYAASSICTPSRFGLFTGQFASRSQDQLLGALMFLDEADAHRGIRPEETLYPQLLQASGYTTALIGKWHLGHGEKSFWPTRHGFETYFGHTGGCVDYFTTQYGNRPDWYRGEELVEEEGFVTEIITNEAVRFLKSREKVEQPFYLHLSYNAPHFGKGWDPQAEKTVNILQPRAQELKRVSQIADQTRRDFAAMVVALDDGIGQVMRTLADTGLADNTLVIFMTDHGGDPVYGGSNIPFRGGKATLFEGGIRVPCLMRWPGHIRAGTETDAVTSAWDIFPTLCHLAGVDVSKRQLDGSDISPLLLEGKSPGDRELFWHTGQHAGLHRGTWTALRQGRWKLVMDAEDRSWLFDIAADPKEEQDLGARHPDVLARLQARQKALTLECRPLLK